MRLTQRSPRALANSADTPLQFRHAYPDATGFARTRDPLSMEQPMEQPTTPAEQVTRAAECQRAVVAATIESRRAQRRLHLARRRRRPRPPVAHVQPDRKHRRDRGDPGGLDALPRRRGALATARCARDLGHARGRARHLRPARPPLHPVAEPLRRRQVVPHARTPRCAAASPSGASSGASRSAT